MELAIGPVLFDWPRDEVLGFYREISKTDVDRVYVGEVVCSKRLGLSRDNIQGIIKLLLDSGKKVALSTLAVISNDEELDTARKLFDFQVPVEANDMSVFNMADPRERDIYAGPHITSYNAPTIEFLKSIGIKRVVFPVELSRESIRHCIEKTGITGEVFAHGKAPLAFSWRCYTSRAFGLSKAECRHDCLKYPDGMDLKTIDNGPLFSINGTSILSAATHTLIEFVEDLREIGVAALRISPQYRVTGRVIEVFRARLNGTLGPSEGLNELKAITKGEFTNGWYLGGAGKDYLNAAGKVLGGNFL
ncbi:MAG: U32 family peptidase [Candidatus Methylomirabilis sp.]|nr:U32 family peptidase [Deltaproteobacteria bacterium]